MKIEMNHSNDWAGFIGGATTTGIYTLTILPEHFMSDMVGKILITIVVSLIGGALGMLGKDFYTQYLQPRVKRFFRKFRK